MQKIGRIIILIQLHFGIDFNESFFSALLLFCLIKIALIQIWKCKLEQKRKNSAENNDIFNLYFCFSCLERKKFTVIFPTTTFVINVCYIQF